MNTGCTTLYMRSESTGVTKHVYPATVFDAQCFWKLGIKGEPPLAMPDSATRSRPLTRAALGVGSVIDLPFSIVSDTVMLPVDLYRLSNSPDKLKTNNEQVAP